MSDWPTLQMVEAAMDAVAKAVDYDEEHPAGHAAVDAGLTAAAEVAPRVEGWVWCAHRDEFRTSLDHDAPYRPKRPCPGPHHPLLLGPPSDAICPSAGRAGWEKRPTAYSPLPGDAPS